MMLVCVFVRKVFTSYAENSNQLDLTYLSGEFFAFSFKRCACIVQAGRLSERQV